MQRLCAFKHSSHWRPLLLVALALALYLPALGVEVLRHPLEAKYALAAREMLHGGPWLVGRLFGELYPDKPPLHFWATALLGHVTGGEVREVTARLPAVAGAIAGLLAVYRLGLDLFGPRAGLLAALVLATGNLFFWYARQGHPDQFLTAFVAVASLGLWRSFTVESPRSRAVWALAAYAAMAGGVLSKGLLGLLLPILTGAAYLLAIGPARLVPARLRLASGLGMFLVVVLAWFGPAVAQHGPGYLWEAVVHQHVVRYARSWVHTAPWYYYLGEFPTGFFPWVLFLPGALLLSWRDREPGGGTAPGPWPLAFPLGWFTTGFVFLSLSTSKRGAYLLPLYPAAALLVGRFLDRALDARVDRRWVTAPLAVLLAAAALLAGALLLLPRDLIPGRMVDTLVPGTPWLHATALACLVGGAAAVWFSWRVGHLTGALAALVGAQAILLLTVAAVRAPQYEARFPVRALAARIHAMVPVGEPVFSLLHDYNFIVAFYVDRSLVPLPGLDQLLAARADTPRYALVDNDGAPVLAAPGVHPLSEARLGPKRIILLRLDPRPR